MKLGRLLDRALRPFGWNLVSRRHFHAYVARTSMERVFGFGAFDFVFDVGANAGQYGLRLRRELGYRGPIHSVEPFPGVARTLAGAAKADGNWTVFQGVIAGGTEPFLPFHVMAGSEFSSLLLPDARFEGRFHHQQEVLETIQVPRMSLAELYRGQAKLHAPARPLLKLDTQGTELSVLESGLDVLPAFAAIQTEMGFRPIYEGASGFREIDGFLQAQGFVLGSLMPNNEGHFPHLLEMDAVYFRRDLLPDLD